MSLAILDLCLYGIYKIVEFDAMLCWLVKECIAHTFDSCKVVMRKHGKWTIVDTWCFCEGFKPCIMRVRLAHDVEFANAIWVVDDNLESSHVYRIFVAFCECYVFCVTVHCIFLSLVCF